MVHTLPKRSIMCFWAVVFTLQLLHSLICLHAYTYDLTGHEWRIINANSSLDIPAVVPGYVLKALQEAKLIGNYMHRYADIDHRWVMEDQWSFTTKFTPTTCMLEMPEVDLYLENVDTFAQITLNRERIADIGNYHRWYRLPVKKYLKRGQNSLSITIRPATQAALDRKAAYPYEVPAVVAVNSIPLYNFARKPASDFGWDWGPAFVPAGIAGAVRLEAYDRPFLSGSLVRQIFDKDHVTLKVLCEFHVPSSGTFRGKLSVEMKSLGIKRDQQVILDTPGVQTREVQVSVDVSRVKLWWPAGIGPHPLYPMTVQYEPEGGTERCQGNVSKIHSNVLERKVGFRDVRLVEVPLPEARTRLNVMELPRTPTDPEGLSVNERCGGFDGDDRATKACKPGLQCVRFNSWWWDCKKAAGESFYFEVNGVPIYSKGANIVPMNVIPTEVTQDYLETLLQYAKEANMNMVRIWGGGRYPQDNLYNWCDENGLMVWQEAMFACSPYPRSEEFLKEVHEEVRQQVMRLGSHPSLVVWGGNNEVETSFNWYPPSRDNPLLYVVDYHKLFVETIGGVVSELDPTRPFLDSSPSNGMLDKKMKVKKWGEAGDPMYGDVHYFNYQEDCQDYRHYPPAKFVSEYGSQSYSSWSTYSSFTAAEDWKVYGPMTEFRQRHRNGTQGLMQQLGRHFRLPQQWEGKDQQATEKLFKDWMYLTQVQQMQCYETAINTWRRYRADPRALTMGVLYWQLNDIWAGASWSSLNTDLRWKPLHYLVRRVFSSLTVVGFRDLDAARVRVFVINDYPVGQKVTLYIHMLSIRDTDSAQCPSPLKVVEVEVQGSHAMEAFSIGMDELLDQTPDAALHSYLMVELVTAITTHESQWTSLSRIPSPWQKEGEKQMGENVGLREDHDLGYNSEGSGGPEMGLQVANNTLVQLEGTHQEGWQNRSRLDDHDMVVNGEGSGGPEVGVHVAHPGVRGRFSFDGIRLPGWNTSEEFPLWLNNFKDMEPLRDPKIDIVDGQQVSSTKVKFRVQSQAVAVFVVLETSLAGHFDQNGFVLPPCRPVEVLFHGRQQVEVEPFMRKMTVTSLFDTQP